MFHSFRRIGLVLLLVGLMSGVVSAQSVPDKDAAAIRDGLDQLNAAVASLKAANKPPRQIADVEVFAKGVDWCLRHDEFYAPGNGKGETAYAKYCLTAIETGLARAAEVVAGASVWEKQTGSTIRGYVSRVDGSVQPYALSLPDGFNEAKSGTRWPLHVKLHGRGGTRNEVRFFAEHAAKKPETGQSWIQLDVFGRTDNAYRWSGETDVFEAIADVKRRVRIDDHRVTLWGFSMGGAGSWHLGLHYPSLWSSVGPGAGFVDFYQYQKQTEQLPPYQHRPLHIYDSIDYVLNMADVPFCTYGGELDAQLVASTRMIDAAKELGLDPKLIIGAGVGHKFTPEGFKEFMEFHLAQSATGRPRFPGRRSIRFVTYTLKYNRCEWVTIEELIEQYERTTVEGGLEAGGLLTLKTSNVAALKIARDVADEVELDGTRLPLRTAGDNLLPDAYYLKEANGWSNLTYDDALAFDGNADLHKRRNLQGPIDDAFMEPFVCVTGSGTGWSAAGNEWADWTLKRFDTEFDKWLRGRIPVVKDSELTDEEISSKNLILFGDPGSNSVLARLLDRLPVKWTETGFEVDGRNFDHSTHGLSLIYPNPLNPKRYVVLNSGHTMHTPDFKNSNAWLFPRLGDLAVQKFERQPDGSFKEEIVRAELFNGQWQLPTNRVAAVREQKN